MQYGINQTITNATVQFRWNGRDGELAVETNGSVKLQRWVRTKYVDIPDTELSSDGSLIFETRSTDLRAVVTGTAEVVAEPFFHG